MKLYLPINLFLFIQLQATPAQKTTCCPFQHSPATKAILFIFLVTLWLLVAYGLVLTTMYEYYHYMLSFLMIASIYSYTFWIVKKSSDIMSTTVEKMAKRYELMKAPTPSKGTKVSSLVPCKYLDTFLVDGRCKYLDASVLDDGYVDWQMSNRTNFKKFTNSLRNCLQMIFSYNTLNVIIMSSCVCIGKDILSRTRVIHEQS